MLKHGAIRQVAPSLAGIQEDHKNRYRWVNKEIRRGHTIMDAGCGIGYGSWIMAQFHNVFAFELDDDALVYARKHYPHPRIQFAQADLTGGTELPKTDAVVCFEMLEHTAAPLVLRALCDVSDMLFCSVPNQEVVPWNKEDFPEHLRHYTPDEFVALLIDNGWNVTDLLGQRSKKDPDIRCTTEDCRIMLARAVRQ